jgi:hypothetical protein
LFYAGVEGTNKIHVLRLTEGTTLGPTSLPSRPPVVLSSDAPVISAAPASLVPSSLAPSVAGSGVQEIMSFNVPRAPSDMSYYASLDLLYILCYVLFGTVTSGEHRIYAYAPNGDGKCMITIPASAGFSRLDGLYIVDNVAFLGDSQGPMYSQTSGRLGGSLYQAEWNNPCGCSRANNATSCVNAAVRPACNCDAAAFAYWSEWVRCGAQVSWTPRILKTWVVSAADATIADGGTLANTGFCRCTRHALALCLIVVTRLIHKL